MTESRSLPPALAPYQDGAPANPRGLARSLQNNGVGMLR